MKREIKFRAWSEGKMIDLLAITPLALDATMNTQLALKGMSGLFIPFGGNIELMQFTGLKDKNGRDIYEGDIIKTDDPNWGYGGKYDKEHDSYLYNEISFEDGCFCIKGGLELYNFKYCEVIGNIYENPELLK